MEPSPQKKKTLQIASTEHKSWREATFELLMCYRATPHATTGNSPALLFHGRKMITPGNLRVQSSLSSQSDSDTEVRERVSEKQAKSGVYTDKVRSATAPKFKVGDLVRVKRPVKRANSKYYPSQRITGKKGRYTYVLEDQRIWNASKLTPCSSVSDDMSSRQVPIDKAQKNVEKEKRERKHPKWMQD